ncbi:MAG: hypothetical protein ACLPH3_09630 [Terracidiphilus sp.]
MHESRSGAEEPLAPEAREEQLQRLIAELLATNQELRFKLALLERQAEDTERAIEKANRWCGLLLP